VILVDTNVIVALADRSDTDHERCRRWLQEQTEQLALPMTVLAEACYLIDRFGGPAAEAQFLGSVGTDASRRFRAVDLTEADLRRMSELVTQYADRRLGGTDASLVAVAERLGVTTIATMNRRDFDNVRPRHVLAFTIVPS
jgi:predicted nucleic acid-binding protein